MTNIHDTELNLLEAIHAGEGATARVTQRGLAQASGLSLGMTNALVRRLAEKGFVRLTRLSAKTVRYALTEAGRAEIGRRTAGFFRRASRSVELYRTRLETCLIRAKRGGAGMVVLAGESDLDFLLEYLCEIHGLAYVRSADPERATALARRDGVMLILAGTSETEGGYPAAIKARKLSEMLTQGGADLPEGNQ